MTRDHQFLSLPLHLTLQSDMFWFLGWGYFLWYSNSRCPPSHYMEKPYRQKEVGSIYKITLEYFDRLPSKVHIVQLYCIKKILFMCLNYGIQSPNLLFITLRKVNSHYSMTHWELLFERLKNHPTPLASWFLRKSAICENHRIWLVSKIKGSSQSQGTCSSKSHQTLKTKKTTKNCVFQFFICKGKMLLD